MSRKKPTPTETDTAKFIIDAAKAGHTITHTPEHDILWDTPEKAALSEAEQIKSLERTVRELAKFLDTHRGSTSSTAIDAIRERVAAQLLKLLPRAVALAKNTKPQIALLRLITRYVGRPPAK